ncbi:MAG: hypothetical protein AAF399_05925 [Bacteroidota bacterium]
MIAFDVFCNEVFLCRMGLPEAERVLSITLTKAPGQDQVSLLAIGKTKAGIEPPSTQTEAEQIEHLKALMQIPMAKWIEESLTPPFQLEIRVVETDDLVSISSAGELVADPTAMDPRALKLFAQAANSSSS